MVVLSSSPLNWTDIVQHTYILIKIHLYALISNGNMNYSLSCWFPSLRHMHTHMNEEWQTLWIEVLVTPKQPSHLAAQWCWKHIQISLQNTENHEAPCESFVCVFRHALVCVFVCFPCTCTPACGFGRPCIRMCVLDFPLLPSCLCSAYLSRHPLARQPEHYSRLSSYTNLLQS